MKKLLPIGVWVLFVTLMGANVMVFMQGVQLSDQIHNFESEITRLKQENSELETKSFDIESITYAASVAAELEYSQKAEPVFFSEKTVALNK